MPRINGPRHNVRWATVLTMYMVQYNVRLEEGNVGDGGKAGGNLIGPVRRQHGLPERRQPKDIPMAT